MSVRLSINPQVHEEFVSRLDGLAHRPGSGDLLNAPSGTSTESQKETSVAKDVVDMAGCCFGIYACYLLYGYLQEAIYKKQYQLARGGSEQFSYSLFLVFFQCVVNGAVALLALLVFRQPSRAVPAQEYAKIATAYVGAMFASNFALNFVSYPTQALAKCCKLIPVMLMGIIVNGKEYKLREYVNVALITAGIICFNLMKTTSRASQSATESSWMGLALLFISLALDGYTGPKEERVIDQYKPSIHQLMYNLNLWAVVLCVAFLVLSGELFEAAGFCVRHPSILGSIVVFSMCSAVGQMFIMMTLFRFNSLVLTTVTTTRKFFTILGSVFWFGHDLNMWQWGGVGLVFTGLGLNIVHKYQRKKRLLQSMVHHAPGTEETVLSPAVTPAGAGWTYAVVDNPYHMKDR